MKRVFYDPDTGKGIFSTDQKIEVYPDWVDCDENNMKDYYYPDGVPTQRIAMTPTITGNDPAVVDSVVAFSGFPDDAKVQIDTDRYQLDDGAINFTPTTPGSYNVRAFHVAYLDYGVPIYAS